MLPVTRANLDNLCSTCLIDIRPSVYTQKVYNVNEEINLSKWLKLTAHITVLRNPMNQKYIEEYCKKLCEICFLKAQYSYYFRENILSATITVKDTLENENISEEDIQKLHKFCRICLNRQKCTQEQTLTMEYLKWLKDGSGLSFTTLIEREIFRLKEGTNITELMIINDAQFPKQLCTKCLKKLKNMEEFRKLATQSFEYMVSVMGDADNPLPPIALPINLRNVDSKTPKPELISLPKVSEGLNDVIEEEIIFEDVKVIQDNIKIEQDELIEDPIEQEELMYHGEIKILENSDNEFDQMIDEKEDYYNADDRNSSEDESSLENIPIAKLKNIECVKTFTISPNHHIASNSLDNNPIGKKEKPKITTVNKKLLRKSKKCNIKDEVNDESQAIPGHNDLKDPQILTKKQSKSKKHVKKVKKEINTDEQNIKNKVESFSIDDSKDIVKLSLEQLNIENDEGNTKTLKRKRSKKSKHPKDNDIKEFKCEECPRVYRHQKSLNTHKQKHREEKPIHCDKCSKTFLTIYILKRHQQEIHCSQEDNEDADVDNPTAKTCTVCSQTFKRKQHLIDHIRAVHEKLKPFKCSYCDKMFATPGNKRVHELCHTDTFPFVCDWCAKRFRQSNQLKVHLEIHTTPSELLCPICKRAQTTTETLQQHLKLHDEKRLQCPSCGKLFTKAAHLRDHQNAVHLKLRPFKCQFCDLAFGDRKTRKVHEKSHTEDRPEVCPICKRGFKSRNSLGRHMKEFGHLTEEFIKNHKKGTKKPKLKPAENSITGYQVVGGLHWMV